MEIQIERVWKKQGYTIGRAYIDGKFFSNTIEDEDRGLRDDMKTRIVCYYKIPGRTAIPTGRYRVTVTWSPRFKRKMPLVNNVKGFDGIRLHSANTAEQLEGCIAFGKNTQVGMVTESRATHDRLERLITEATERKEEVWLTIR